MRNEIMKIKLKKEIKNFAKYHGYEDAKYIGKWREYKVYEPIFSKGEISYIGLPLVILVNKKGEIRMSTDEEAMANLRDKSSHRWFWRR